MYFFVHACSDKWILDDLPKQFMPTVSTCTTPARTTPAPSDHPSNVTGIEIVSPHKTLASEKEQLYEIAGTLFM